MARQVKWTEAQLRHLTQLEAEIRPGVHIHLIPISKGGLDVGYGTQIVWDARLYKRGVMGPRPVAVEELVAVDVPREEAERWVEQTHKAVQTLNRLYPVIVPAIEERVKAIQAAVPEALPAGGE
jgi:hypothetical protein